MLVKFTKNQIKALSSISSRAEIMFTELQKEKSSLYPECDRRHTVHIFELGILDSIISLGEIYVDE